jgi:gliding motility-associated-like protein
MKQFLTIVLVAFFGQLIAQTQFLDQYGDIDIRDANLVGTSDQGWITVADVQIDSFTQKLGIIKFDMCGDLEWANYYSIDNVDFHHAEIIQNGSQEYHVTCFNNDLSLDPSEIYLLKLNNSGAVISGIQHALMGQNLSHYSIGTDLAIFSDSNVITETNVENLDKCLAVFEHGENLKWVKQYTGLTRMSSPMGIEVINDSLIFVTNTFQVALLDTSGQVLWAMENDSMVVWPEVAYLQDNTIGVLASWYAPDSVETAQNRRHTYLVTFPQATPFPVMHKGTDKILRCFPELHAVGDRFVMAALDTVPELDAYVQSFTFFDQFGTPEEQKYLADFLGEGVLLETPFLGFDYNSGFGYVTYAAADSNIYFGKLDGGMEVGDMMACIPEMRDTFLDEILNYWTDLSVVVDSIGINIDTAIITVEKMDTLVMNRRCENEIPPGESMRSLCKGDTIFIGGNPVFEEGTYFDTTVICGDTIINSTEVTYQVVQDTIEPRIICEGDSTFFRGQFYSAAGQYRFVDTICQMSRTYTYSVNFVPRNPNPDTSIQGCIGGTLVHVDPVTGATTNFTTDTTFVISYPDAICDYIIDHRFEYTFVEDDEQLKTRIPNAFTPNNDGMNDGFGLALEDTDMLTIESFKMSIYNRWGQEIFTTTNPDGKWNGNVEDTKAVSEVYLYSIEIFGDLNGCNIDGAYTGDVTLVR